MAGYAKPTFAPPSSRGSLVEGAFTLGSRAQTYYELLRLLEAEYCSPGANNLSLNNERPAVDKAIESLRADKSSWEAFKLSLWYPGLFFIRALSRRLDDRCMVVASMDNTGIKSLKEKALLNPPSVCGTAPFISGNDALTAWIANAIGAVGFTYACNLRDKVNNLPTNVNANAEDVWMVGLGTTRAIFGPPLHALDVRRSVKAQGNTPGATLTQMLFARICTLQEIERESARSRTRSLHETLLDNCL